MHKKTKYFLVLVVLGYFFLMFGNSVVNLTIPDEVFYAQTAKEMIQHKTWITPYLFDQPQFEKPIFLYWLLRLSFVFFGITNFAARFFPALFGMVGVLAVYFLGSTGFKNEKKAFLSALILSSSGLYIGLSRTVFTDMVFSIFILFALAAFFWGYLEETKRDLGLVLFFAFSGLAVLTKGPLGFFIPFFTLIVFLITQKRINFLFSKAAVFGFLLFILISFPWYIFMLKTYGGGFIKEFFYNDHLRRLFEAEHIINDTWYFYPAAMIVCMFPWSTFVLFALILLFKDKRKDQPVYTYLACWIAVTFLIFQPAHSKLTSYIFPLFPALALITGDYIEEVLSSKKKNRLFSAGMFITLSLVLLFPLGMIITHKLYAGYLKSVTPIYFWSGIFLLYLGSILLLWLRRKFRGAIYLLSFLLFIFISIVPFIHQDIEPYISSHDVCAYLLRKYPVDSPLLCSKLFVRGVRYYTDMPVAILSTYAKNFFSPHPVPFLYTDEEARDFLRKYPITYAVLKKTGVEDIERIGREQGFKIIHLEVMGNAYLVKIEPEKK